MLNGNMHSPMRSWPMTDWDHDDHEKGAYHEAGHAAVLWTFGVPPTGAVHLEHETHGGCTATELGAATRLSPSTKSLRGSSACPVCGGGRRWRLRWPRGRGLRRPWRQHGATHSGWIRSSRTRTEVALEEDKAHDWLFGERHSRRQSSRARRYHRGWRAPLPKRKSTNPPANSCGREVILPISNCSRN
jgi:hypothetical protein